MAERDGPPSPTSLAARLQHVQLDASAAAAPACAHPVRDFLVEFHGNIACYHCYLQVDGDTMDQAKLRISTSALCVRVYYETADDTASQTRDAWWQLETEYVIDIEQCAIAVKADHVYLRLPVQASAKVPVDAFASHRQPSAAELTPANYAHIACRHCRTPLRCKSREPAIDKVLPLPSEHWVDMFDFWGSGIGAFEHLPREQIGAQQQRVLVGEAHLLMHDADIDADAIEKEDMAPPTEKDEAAACDQPTSVLRCSHCSSIVGARPEDMPHTLRLLKHAISSTHDDGQGVNIFASLSVASALCCEMLQAAEASGIFRFQLHAPAQPDLRLQLLSWDTMLRTPSSTTFQRALKVVYSVEALDGSKATLKMRAHHLSLDAHVCADLLERLEASTNLLPASQQQFNRMRVGYLFS